MRPFDVQKVKKLFGLGIVNKRSVGVIQPQNKEFYSVHPTAERQKHTYSVQFLHKPVMWYWTTRLFRAKFTLGLFWNFLCWLRMRQSLFLDLKRYLQVFGACSVRIRQWQYKYMNKINNNKLSLRVDFPVNIKILFNGVKIAFLGHRAVWVSLFNSFPSNWMFDNTFLKFP